MDKKTHLNKVKNRILNLSPTVKEGLERECCKDDFFSEGDKPIGKGGFGQVWKVRHKLSNRIYVIKVMSKKNIIEQKMVEQINREVDIMYKLNHPHIIKLYNHYEDEDNLYLIMQYASKGQLYAHLKKQNKIDQRNAAQYMRELLSAVKYLHSAFTPSIIHRDIKPENILLDENGSVKLADFGWSNYDGDKKRTTYCGTPEYLAPEMIRKEGHDTSIDIWDLGVLCFELLAGKPPFQGSNNAELFSNIKKHKIQWPDDFPPLAKNLISKILRQNPKDRISLDEIYSHVWFDKNPPIRPVEFDITRYTTCDVKSNLINIPSDNIGAIPKDNEKKRKVSASKEVLTNLAGEISKHSIAGNNNDLKYIEDLNSTIEKLKKERDEWRGKFEKNENELKGLRLDVLRQKESLCKTNQDGDVIKLRDELEKYKIMNKDRLALLTEIEEKNNEISELKSKIKYLENEAETLKRNIKNLTENNSELTLGNETKDGKIAELTKSIDDLNKEKYKESHDYQKKIEILQAKIFDSLENQESDMDHSLATDKLISIIGDSIEEFKNLFKNKILTIESMLKDVSDEREQTESKVISHFEEKNNNVIDTIKRIKASLEEDFVNIKLKLKKENPQKVNERVDWLKKQVSELLAYKGKSANLEINLHKSEVQISLLNEKINLDKMNIELLEKYKVDSNIKIQKLEKTYRNLEDRLSDLKDFIFKNCPEKLDELNSYYKF